MFPTRGVGKHESRMGLSNVTASLTVLKIIKQEVSIPNEVTGFLNRPNPFNRTMDLGSTQHLTEMSVRNLLVSKGRPAGA
jgi:hypothetical protein